MGHRPDCPTGPSLTTYLRPWCTGAPRVRRRPRAIVRGESVPSRWRPSNAIHIAFTGCYRRRPRVVPVGTTKPLDAPRDQGFDRPRDVGGAQEERRDGAHALDLAPAGSPPDARHLATGTPRGRIPRDRAGRERGTPGPSGPPSRVAQLQSSGDEIQHVMYFQFDNVHFQRDNPNVPSDVEQMPNLLNFISAERHAPRPTTTRS